MNVNDVKGRARLLPLHTELRDRTAEDAEAASVVVIVAPVLSVNLRPVVQARHIKKQQLDSRPEPSDRRPLPTQPRRSAPPCTLSGVRRRARSSPRRLDGWKTRERDGHLVAKQTQRLGKRRDDIGETADLDHRRELGGDEEDIHQDPPLAQHQSRPGAMRWSSRASRQVFRSPPPNPSRLYTYRRELMLPRTPRCTRLVARSPRWKTKRSLAAKSRDASPSSGSWAKAAWRRSSPPRPRRGARGCAQDHAHRAHRGPHICEAL